MSVSLAFEPNHRVLRVQFFGRMSQEGLHNLDASVVAFVKKEGPTRGFVIDCSAVDDFDVPTGEFVRRGMRQSIVSDQERVYVMPRDDMYGLGRMFGTYQRIAGKREPLVVKTIGEAYSALRLTNPVFEEISSEAGPAAPDGGQE